MATEELGTLGQVIEMQPGDKAWINFAFDAYVTGVATRKTKTNAEFVTATLTDPHNDSIRCEISIFGRRTLPFEGALCRFSGSGMRRDEYNGQPKVAASNKTIINKLGDAPSSAARSESSGGQPQQQASQNQQQQHENRVHGQTVGMVINNAVSIVIARLCPAELSAAIKYVDSPAFSKDVYTISSDLLRISDMLQNGRLAESAKSRSSTPEEKAAAAAAAAKAKADAEAKAKAEAETKAKAEAEERARQQQAQSAGTTGRGVPPGAPINEDDIPF